MSLNLNGLVGVPSYTSEVTFSTSGWVNANYPVSNLGTYEIAEPWRSYDTQLANTKFDFALPRTVPLSLIVLCRHNLTQNARWRIKTWLAEDPTAITDSGWLEVWPAVYDPLDLEWEDDNFWTLTYSFEDVKGSTLYVPHLLTDWGNSNRGSVEIDDQGNPDGFVQIGSCEIAHHWQFHYNYATGAQFGFQSRSKYRESEGGGRHFKRLPKPRVFNGVLKYLPIDEVVTKAFEHQRIYDIDVPFFWWPEPLNPKNSMRTAYLARNQDLDLMALSAPLDAGDVPISFIEVL